MVTRRKSIAYGCGPLDVDRIICRLTAVPHSGSPTHALDVSEHEIKMICTLSRQILLTQPMLLELSAPLKIVGEPMRMGSLSYPTRR